MYLRCPGKQIQLIHKHELGLRWDADFLWGLKKPLSKDELQPKEVQCSTISPKIISQGPKIMILILINNYLH
jgi:hypothetical protein